MPTPLDFLYKRLPLLAVLIAALLLPGPVLGAGTPGSTCFLPLKINADHGAAKLADQADRELAAAVSGGGGQLIARTKVEAARGYSGPWPPTVGTLSSLVPPGTQYVATGSLTRLGKSLSVDMAVFDLANPAHIKYFYEEARTPEDLPKVLNRLTASITGFTNRYSIIGTVTLTGNKKIDTGAIMQKIPIGAGDLYDLAKIRQAVKDIYAMGYFDNITVYRDDTDHGIALSFELKEKAVIGQIIIAGTDEIEEDEVREVVAVVPNSIISTKDIQDSIDNIKKLYKDKGLYNTKVASEITPAGNGTVNVSFTIKEGHKVYIKKISFTGNKSFDDDELKKIMQTSERNWLSWLTDSGLLNYDIVEQDAARLGAFYHNHGYVDAKIGKPEITQKDEWLYINFNISEGERYRVGTVDFAGDFVLPESDLFKLTRIKDLDYFNRKTLRDDSQRLTDKFAEKGYAFADVKDAMEKDPLNRRVNINFNMKKNDLVYINRITIKGNTRTRDKVIRREVRLKESGLFNSAAIKRTHARLQRLGYFETVDVKPVPTSEDNLMDLVVTVKEKATGNFSIGAGYSSIDSFMFMSEISQKNFLGKGQSMSLQANISGISTQYNFHFTEPHLADTDLLFGFDLYDWSREYEDYTKNSDGAGIRFGHPVFKKWMATWGYSFDHTTLTDVNAYASQDILDSMEIEYTSSVNFNLFYDTRNRNVNPSSGHTYSLKTKYAGGFLGGDAEFTKLEATTNWYYPLPWDTVFHYKLSAAQVFSNDDSHDVPVFERYYLGGINTVRGFDNGDITPKDPVTGEDVGGAKMWYTNVECIFPLIKEAGLRGVVFFDAGNVYSEHDSWDFSYIRKSVGFGFRWLSPMGPLRLEYGYNLDPEPDEDSGVWDFSIGSSF